MQDPVDDEGEPRRRAAAVGLAAVGAVAGLAIGLAAMVLLVDDEDGSTGQTPSSPTTIDLDQDTDLAAAFLRDWHRWRTTELRVDYGVVRTRTDGEELVSAKVVVQRGDDRLTGGLQDATGIVAGTAVNCRPASGGGVECFEDPAPVDVDQARQDELEHWATQLAGEPPFYRILDGGPGCYDLILTRAVPAADFGREATLCFDENGALGSTRIVWENGLTEHTTATAVSTTVTDDDFSELLGGARD